jgi:hypothetical protein
MPDWFLAPVCLLALLGFIGYALYRGTKVPPDRNNSNFGPSQNDGQMDGTHSGSDGHSGN